MAERYLGLGSNAIPDETGGRPASVLFPGNFPGIQEASRLTRLEQLEVKDRIVTAHKELLRPLRDLPFAQGEFAVALVRNGAVNLATGDLQLAAGDVLYTAGATDQPSPLDEFFANTGKSPRGWSL